MDKDNKNKTFLISLLIISFIFGWFLNSLFLTLDVHKEKPFFGSEERSSPYDRVKERNLQLFSDKLVINFPYIQLASYADTNSMDPLIDEHANGLEIIPESEEEVHVGDIIAYQSGDDLISHRVTFIGEDGLGWYAIAKGDNSDKPEKVRFGQIKYILIGILY